MEDPQAWKDSVACEGVQQFGVEVLGEGLGHIGEGVWKEGVVAVQRRTVMTVDEISEEHPVTSLEFMVKAEARLDEDGVANACAECTAERKDAGGDTKPLVKVTVALEGENRVLQNGSVKKLWVLRVRIGEDGHIGQGGQRRRLRKGIEKQLCLKARTKLNEEKRWPPILKNRRKNGGGVASQDFQTTKRVLVHGNKTTEERLAI